MIKRLVLSYNSGLVWCISFCPLLKTEKVDCLQYKADLLLEKINSELNIEFSSESLANIYDIDLKHFHNLRKLNLEIMLKISEEYQEIIGD